MLLKEQVIATIAEDCGETRAVVDKVLKSLATTLKANLISVGDKIKIHGVATFEVKHQAARTARNPQNGETIQVPEKTVIKAKSNV